MSLPTPISWFGGKTYLRGWILPYLEDDNQVYVEPFCGSANILFAKPPHPVEVINDLDDLVVNFFRVLQNRRLFRHFAHRVRWTPFASEEFHQAIDLCATPITSQPSLDHAWAFFVRGTQGYSGSGTSLGNWRRTLMESGGMAATCQHWKSRLSNLEGWRDRLLRVQVDHRPALDVIRFYDSPNTTFYIDPPYVEDTRKSLDVYAHEMTDSDHKKLVELLTTVQGRVVLSGYGSSIYKPLEQKQWRRYDKTVSSPMTIRRDGTPQDQRVEVLWINREAMPSLFADETPVVEAVPESALTSYAEAQKIADAVLADAIREPRPESPPVGLRLVPALSPPDPGISLPGPAQPEIPGVRATPSPGLLPGVPPPSLADMFSSEGVFAAIGEAIGEMRDLTAVERSAIQTALRGETTQSDASKPLSMIEMLGDYSPPSSDQDYKLDEPPSLDGIDEIILNVETKGLNWWAGEGVIGITVGTLDGQLCRFLPLGFRGGNLDESVVKFWAQRELRGKAILNTNTRFDIHQMREWGTDLAEQGCTFSDIQHYAALCDDHRKQFKLDALAKELLGGVREIRVDESHMVDYHASEVVDRAKYQVELVARLRDEFWPIMDQQNLHKVRSIEDSVIPVVVEMEKNAAVLDRGLLAEMTRDAEEEYLGLLKQISTEVGFNFDDKPESWERLFIACGLDIPRLKSKKSADGISEVGKATFKDEILSRIDHPTIKLARYAAQLDSLRSKIFKPYTELVADDGTLRYYLNQLRSEEGGTVSGRFSAAYVQQVPNHDNHAAVFGEKYFPRRLYIPRTGVFVAADAAQIEYRLFAHLAKNPKVLKAYQENPDASFHKMIQPMIAAFKADINYTAVKSLNFMRIYGGSLIKTAVMMGFISEEEGDRIHDAKNQWTEPKLAQARDISNIYDRELPEVKPLLRTAMHLAMPECDRYCKKDDEMHKRYQHRGYVTTLCGRRARFPTFHKIHKALNSVIQGTAADLLKLALVDVYNERKNLGFTMRATVHDEIWGDLDHADGSKLISDLLNQQRLDLLVPIRWVVGTGSNWAEAK